MNKLRAYFKSHRALLGFLVLVAAMLYLFAQLHSQNNQLHQIVRNELHNRVTNVEHWCTGINQNRNESRVLFEHRGLTYRLHNLNCAKIVQQTQKSAH